MSWSSISWVVLFGLLQIVISNSDIEVNIIPTDAATFLEQGDDFTAYCNANFKSGSSKTSAPDIYFVIGNERIVETPSIKLASKTDNATLTSNISITFTNINVTDATGLGCRIEYLSETNQIKVYVVPKKSIPTITVGPQQKVITDINGNIELKCKAEIESADLVDLSIEWNFRDPKGTLPTNSVPSQTEGTDLVKNSTLSLTKVNIENQGNYYCSAILTMKDNTRIPKYHKNIDVTVKVMVDAGKVEEKVKAGEDATFNCAIAVKNDQLLWFKEKDEINNDTDSRYMFYGRPQSVLFTIKDVTYTDRSEYKCESKLTGHSKTFILRVRDPLGALWPFVGIVIEAIILVIILVIHEAYKKSKSNGDHKDDMLDSPVFKETSPLVKTTPKVSYSGSGDKVRARVTTDSTA